MALRIARPQALVERWGCRALPSDEGTCPPPRCQRGQPSTSTSDLRVAARDRTLGDRDVEVGRAARGRACEARNDAVRDRDLEPQVDGRAEPDLEAAAQAERDLAVERTYERHAPGEAAADERGERAGGKPSVLTAQERAELDLGGCGQPDARKRRVRPSVDRRDHAAA